jgi:hypothetical protein
MSSGKKFKALDPQRSNTLPRYVTEESILASSQREKEKKKLLSSSLDNATRDEIRRLMKSENGANNAAMQRIEEKKRIELEKRKAHEEAIYSLDMDTLETTFHLPGKPGARTTLPAELSRRTPVKKAVKVSHNEKNAQESAGMNFLPNLLGESTSPFSSDFVLGLEDVPYQSPQTNSMLPSPGAGGRPLSDLDQISEIMSGIHTGADAINFFARYGSDTPVPLFFLALVSSSVLR